MFKFLTNQRCSEMLVELKIRCVLLSAFILQIIFNTDQCLGKIKNWTFESVVQWDKGINIIDCSLWTVLGAL